MDYENNEKKYKNSVQYTEWGKLVKQKRLFSMKHAFSIRQFVLFTSSSFTKMKIKKQKINNRRRKKKKKIETPTFANYYRNDLAAVF